MSYLLAKIVFLLLLAALFGAWLAWWAARRRYEDVTVEYTSWQSDWARWRKSLDEKLANPPVANLEPVLARLHSLEADVRGIHIPHHTPTDLSPVLSAMAALRMPEPTPPTDLAPLQSRLGALDAFVRGIIIPPPKEPDFAPLLARLDGLESRVGGIRMPEPAPAVDLGPLQLRLAEIEKAVKGISIPVPKEPKEPKEPDLSPVLARLGGLDARLAAFKWPEPAPAVNLAPLHSQIKAVEQVVAAIRIPPAAAATDLGPVQARLSELDKAIRAIVIPAPKEPDLSAVLARLGGLETRLATFKWPEPAPAVNLLPLQSKVDAVERAVAAFRMPDAPAPVDLQPLHARLAELERGVKGISFPVPKEPDLSAVLSRFGALETRLNAIRLPEAPPPVDLRPLGSRLEALERTVGAIRFPEPKPADLSRVEAQLAGLERRLAAPQPTFDLGPTHQRMAALEAALHGIAIPPALSIDLGPLMERMSGLESSLAGLAALPAFARVLAPAPRALAVAPIDKELVRSGSRNLLARAAFGQADDLKRINGVAEVLEKMLHDVGVYYFWQIAEWTPKDIAYVDSQLTAFKGRIRRDEWKPQAARLARLPEAARRPRG